MPSSQDQEAQRDEYLTDFIYIDKNRIASYIAQIHEQGVLTRLVENNSAEDCSDYGFNFGIKGLLAAGENVKTNLTQSAQKTFDASWSVIIDFIIYLNSNNYLIHEIDRAALGQIVSFEGEISIRDLRLLEKILDIAEVVSPELFGALGMNPTPGRVQTAAEKKKLKAIHENNNNNLTIIRNLPYTVTFSAFNESNSVWATLEPGNMQINTVDLMYKHGNNIPGEWKIIGLLDARPSAEDERHSFSEPKNEITNVIDSLMEVTLKMGRDSSSYAITPLAIYRQVKADRP